MNEKHILFYRETPESQPEPQDEFPTYLSAIQAGQKLGFGTWWVESKHFVNNRFEAFAPELPEEDFDLVLQRKTKKWKRANLPYSAENASDKRFLRQIGVS